MSRSGMSGRMRRASSVRCTASSGARGRLLTGGTIDQLMGVIDQIKRKPDSRRLIVSAWNVGEIEQMALPPCHVLFQFYVANGRLSCQLYQRSVDVFLGLPFNIASYALLTLMVAQVCDLQPGEFIHTSGDAHLYRNHFEQARLQLTREPRPLPQMRINPEREGHHRLRLRGFRANRLRSAPAHQGRHLGVARFKKPGFCTLSSAEAKPGFLVSWCRAFSRRRTSPAPAILRRSHPPSGRNTSRL